MDEVDWELEKRGLAFARYADDCNVYVKSKRAAERAAGKRGMNVAFPASYFEEMGLTRLAE